MKFLGVLILVTVVYQIYALDFACQTNKTYVLDENYPCECISYNNNDTQTQNVLNCDLSRCPPKPYVKQSCSLGDSWKKGCNQCWCKMIGTVCTNDTCSSGAQEHPE